RARVRGPDHALALREVVPDSVAAEAVVAERDHVRAGTQQPVGELRRDSRAVRDVFAVDDADVGTVLLAQAGQALLDRVAPRDAALCGWRSIREPKRWPATMYGVMPTTVPSTGAKTLVPGAAPTSSAEVDPSSSWYQTGCPPPPPNTLWSSFWTTPSFPWC